MPNNISFVVCTICKTYNQSSFIEETMNGFVIQETNFPFVCVIVDDASTDGEQKVIKQFLEEHFFLDDKTIVRNLETNDYTMIFAQHKVNKNCFFAVFFLKYNHTSIKKLKEPYYPEYFENVKYLAECEGDDFWIHPKKLQIQVDFLEEHQDYSMVHTDFDLVKGRRRHVRKDPSEDGIWFPRILLEGMSVGTLTAMYRKSSYDKTPKLYIGKGWPMGDKPLWYELAYEGRIKYIPIVTAKYRILENSASHSTDINKMIAFKDAGVKIRMFYANYWGVDLHTDGYGVDFYKDIIRFACRLNDRNISEKFYMEAKKKKVLTLESRFFYLASKYPFIKAFVQTIIKV